jgi:hypothetical protein
MRRNSFRAAINGMPASVVNNMYKTLVSTYATTALNGLAGSGTLNGVTNLKDNVLYFVGNTVDGGRQGELGSYHGGADARIYALHFCGNAISLLPGFNRSDDYPGAAVNAVAMAWANISGNTLLQGGLGVRWGDLCTNSIVLKNNFAAASHSSLAYEGTNGQARSIQIIKNVLNQGCRSDPALPWRNRWSRSTSERLRVAVNCSGPEVLVVRMFTVCGL